MVPENHGTTKKSRKTMVLEKKTMVPEKNLETEVFRAPKPTETVFFGGATRRFFCFYFSGTTGTD